MATNQNNPAAGGSTPSNPLPLKPGESPEEIANRLSERFGRIQFSQVVADAVEFALRAYGDRRGEEERAKALEDVALHFEGNDYPVPRFGDAIARDIRAYAALAAAPSGDADALAEAREEHRLCTGKLIAAAGWIANAEEDTETARRVVDEFVRRFRNAMPPLGLLLAEGPARDAVRGLEDMVDELDHLVPSGDAKAAAPDGMRAALDEAVTIMFDTYAVIGACLDQMRKHRSGPGTEFDESATLLERQLTEMVQLSNRLGKSIGHPASGDAKGTK